MIDDLGGLVAGSVTKSVTILVCNQTGTKNCKDTSEAKGVKVVTRLGYRRVCPNV